MHEETKQCQNCHTAFTIDASDFALLSKFDIQEIDECTYCIWKRMLAFWVFGVFRKGKSAFSGKTIITTFSDQVKFPIYVKLKTYIKLPFTVIKRIRTGLYAPERVMYIFGFFCLPGFSTFLVFFPCPKIAQSAFLGLLRFPLPCPCPSSGTRSLRVFLSTPRRFQ